jgi:valyl-tRNA synthetase
VIAQYGADALRFTILYLAPLGQDVHYSNDKCEMGRNFANKVWNAGRFLLLNKAQLLSPAVRDELPHRGTGPGPEGQESPALPEDHLDLADRWLLSRLHSTIGELTSSLEQFEINQATKILYDFLWHDFCDWYLEMVKGRLYGDEPAAAKNAVLNRAIGMFDQSLRLLHPFMPFITEELWQHLAPRKDGESIMVAPFPVREDRWIDKKTEEEMAFVQLAINSVRNVRGELSVPPSKEIELVIRFSDAGREKIIVKYLSYFQRLARVVKIQHLKNGTKPRHAASAVVDGGEIFIPLEGVIDLEAERERLRKEIAHTRRMLDSIQSKLGNEHFVGKAPKEVVDREREKLEHFRANLEKLQKHLAEL